VNPSDTIANSAKIMQVRRWIFMFQYTVNFLTSPTTVSFSTGTLLHAVYFYKSIEHRHKARKLCTRRTYWKKTTKIFQSYVHYCKTMVLAYLGNSCISTACVPSVWNKTKMAPNCGLICYTIYEFHFSFQQLHSITNPTTYHRIYNHSFYTVFNTP
jgi:hypothetical protein